MLIAENAVPLNSGIPLHVLTPTLARKHAATGGSRRSGGLRSRTPSRIAFASQIGAIPCGSADRAIPHCASAANAAVVSATAAT